MSSNKNWPPKGEGMDETEMDKLALSFPEDELLGILSDWAEVAPEKYKGLLLVPEGERSEN